MTTQALRQGIGWGAVLAVVGLLLLVSSFVLDYHHYSVVLLALSAMVAIPVVFMRPLWGVVLLMLVCNFVEAAPNDLSVKEFAYIGLFILIFLTWVTKALIGQYEHKYSLLGKVWLALGLLVFLGSFNAAFNGMEPWKIIRGLVPFGNLLMFFVVCDEVRETRDINKILWAMRLTGILFIFVTLLSVFPVLGSARSWVDIRASLDSGTFATYLVMSLAFFIGQSTTPNKLVALDAAALVGILLVIATTFLRSALILTVLCALVYVTYAIWHKRLVWLLKVFALVLVLTIGATFVIAVHGRARDAMDVVSVGFERRFEEMFTQENVRVLETKEVIEEVGANVLIGRGTGYRFRYLRALPKYTGSYHGNVYWEGGFTHNIFSYFYLDFGLIGVGLLLFTVYAVIKTWYQAYKACWDYRSRSQVFVIGIVLATVFAYANIQPSVRTVNFLLVVSVLAGFLSRFSALAETPKQQAAENSDVAVASGTNLGRVYFLDQLTDEIEQGKKKCHGAT